MRIDRIMKEFKINKFLTLKLEEDKTNIYINERLFEQCKYLMLNIAIDKIESYEEINSIDEAADVLGWTYDGQEGVTYEIDPETEFWGHCSNVQVWAEQDYDTRLLHSNLSFPLLAELVKAGDPIAKKVINEEIIKRFESGSPNVMLFLIKQGYTKYLIEDNIKINILEGNPDLREYLANNTHNFRDVVFPIYNFLIQIGDTLAEEEFLKDVYVVLDKYYNETIFRWYDDFITKSPKIIMKGLCAILKNKDYNTLLRFIYYDGFVNLGYRHIEELLTSSDFDLIDELINAVNSPEAENTIFALEGIFHGDFLKVAYPYLKIKINNLLRQKNENDLLTVMDLGYIKALNYEDILDLFNIDGELLLLTLIEAMRKGSYSRDAWIDDFLDKHKILISNQLKTLMIKSITQDRKENFNKSLDLCYVLTDNDLNELIRHPNIEWNYLRMIIWEINNDGDISDRLDAGSSEIVKQKELEQLKKKLN